MDDIILNEYSEVLILWSFDTLDKKDQMKFNFDSLKQK